MSSLFCEATTKLGEQCRRCKKENCNFCPQHLKISIRNNSTNNNIDNVNNVDEFSNLVVTSCNPRSRKFCNNLQCLQCFKKSFASHEKAKYWSKNNKIEPRFVAKFSHNNFKFDCKICKHEIEVSLNHMAVNENGCIYCANHKLCEIEDCKICYSKSFASHFYSKYWSKRNILNPRQVLKCASKDYIFDCNICKHEFEIPLTDIARDRWCNYCASKNLCTDQNCKICYEKSFASHEKAKYWCNLNVDNPRDVFKSSSEIYKFECTICGNIFEMRPNTITYYNCWCSCTIFKTSTKLFEWFNNNYDLKIEKEKRFGWCKNERCLPFDFCIEEHKIIVEMDGLQHFIQVMNWKSPEEQQKWDKYKMNCANQNGYSVIRILQEDVWNNKNNWEINLKNVIMKYDKPINIMIGDIYKDHLIYFQ